MENLQQKSQLFDLQKKLDERAAEAQQLRSAQSDYYALNQKLQKLEQDNEFLQVRIQTVIGERNELQEKLKSGDARYQRELAELLARLSAKESEHESQRRRMLSELEEARAGGGAKYLELQAEASKKQQELSELQGSLRQLTSVNERLEKEN